MKEAYYAQAEALLASGEYKAVVNVFFHAGNYRDALKRGYQIIYGKTVQGTLSAGRYHTIGLRADGTVVAVGDYREGQCDVSDWKDIGRSLTLQ
ncbi:MAG: RCC1 domain-containing protein [Clostridia bacterium]